MQTTAPHAFERANVYFRHLPYEHPHHPRHSDRHKHRYATGAGHGPTKEPKAPLPRAAHDGSLPRSSAADSNALQAGMDVTGATLPYLWNDPDHATLHDGSQSHRRQLKGLWGKIVNIGKAIVTAPVKFIGAVVSTGYNMVAGAVQGLAKAADAVFSKAGDVIGKVVDKVERVAEAIGEVIDNGKEFEWSHDRSWDMFGFNFDPLLRKPQEERMRMYESRYFNITCQSCFANLQAGLEFSLKIRARIKAPFIVTEHFLAAVDGNFNTEANVVMEAGAAWQLEGERVVLNDRSVGSVTVFAGPVPIYIDAMIKMKVSNMVVIIRA